MAPKTPRYRTDKLEEMRCVGFGGHPLLPDAEEYRVVLPTGISVDVTLRVLDPPDSPPENGLGRARYRRPSLEEVLLTISNLYQCIDE